MGMRVLAAPSLLPPSLDKMEDRARILKDNNFGHLTETFLVEKISTNLVSSLSAHEMNELCVTDRGDMMTLGMACWMLGCQKPHRSQLYFIVKV